MGQNGQKVQTTLLYRKGDKVGHKTSEVVGVITDCNIKPWGNTVLYCVCTGGEDVWLEEATLKILNDEDNKIGFKKG
jgi:hypothetical protein